MTTKAEIREWLEKGLEQGDSHVIVACDTFDHSDYPIYIHHGTNPKTYPLGEMQRAMECYCLALPIEDQLNESRANHWDHAEMPMPAEPETLEELQAEAKAKEEEAVYDTLEDDIMQMRSDVRAQAELLGQMELSMINPFLRNVLKLESLQVKYDEWEPDDV
jgi:hypothetical protein